MRPHDTVFVWERHRDRVQSVVISPGKRTVKDHRLRTMRYEIHQILSIKYDLDVYFQSIRPNEPNDSVAGLGDQALDSGSHLG